MKPLELIIQTEPHAKARARTSWRNGVVHSYTPDSTQEAEAFIKDFIRPYNKYRCPEQTALKVTLLFFRTKSKWQPKRVSKPYIKSDIDNYEKLVIDAITKKHTKKGVPEDDNYLIKDDAQITTLIGVKRWTKDLPYIKIIIEEDLDA
jgi:Holliday junction resolvase RusA-like endonuclease